MTKPHILQETDSPITYYKEIDEFTDEQLKIFWLPDEVKVEKDVHDILTNMTESERHGVITTLKLFTLYELRAGSDYWTGRFKKTFKRPEFQAMAATFGMTELAIHKKFYKKINELLHLDNDEFYLSYVNDPVLKSRMEFIEDIVSNKNNLVSLAGFSMVEGVVLYGSFGFLKHFQTKGKNKLNNIVRGINFSIRDETLHSLAGAWTFRKLKEQSKLSVTDDLMLKDTIDKLSDVIVEHEDIIIDKVFEKGSMDGTTPESMKTFVRSRVNVCYEQFGFEPKYDIIENPVADYFYNGVKKFSMNDFFVGISNQYHRNWPEDGFVWETKGE